MADALYKRPSYDVGMPVSIRSKRPVKLYLREWREALKLTQPQVAERIGTGKDQISRWETDKRGVKVNVLAAYAEALGFLNEDGTPDIGPLLRHPDAPSIDELLRRSSAPQAVRVQAFDVVEALVKRTGTKG